METSKKCWPWSHCWHYVTREFSTTTKCKIEPLRKYSVELKECCICNTSKKAEVDYLDGW